MYLEGVMLLLLCILLMRLLSWIKITPRAIISGRRELRGFGFIIRGVGIEAPRLIGRTTAHKSLKRIWDLVMDGQSWIIGVHGMTGVGKTAIMKNIYNQLLDTQPNQFDDVIWVCILRRYMWSRLQIEHMIQIEELTKGRRVVLIVDGFLMEEEEGRIKTIFNKDNRSKLVFTTTSIDVCTRMGCKEDWIVKVEFLSEMEALELFWDRVKVKANPTPRMTEIAEEVVKACSRLPLDIVSVGGKFKGRSESQWAKLLLEMKNSEYGIVDISETFRAHSQFSGVKVSAYALLSNGQVSNLNMCALYPKDCKILTKELIQYRHMLALDRYVGEEPERVVMFLKSNGYLESVEVDFEDHHEWGEGVQMHPLYRKLALQCFPERMISKCGLMLKDLPKGAEWSILLASASFMCNNIRTISISPKCPRLTILFLNKNPDLCTISHRFFVHMICLRILDLRDNYKLETLPDSVSNLVNLQALRLSRCWRLKRVPSLVMLLNMKMLELDETAIEELPHGIEMLVKLKFLKLHSLRLKEPIPSDYLSMLHSLPHLELHL